MSIPLKVINPTQATLEPLVLTNPSQSNKINPKYVGAQLPFFISDLTHTGRGVSSAVTPLGAGLVGAKLAGDFGDKVKIKLFKYPELLARELENTVPTITGFSNYMWNIHLSHEFAKRIKEKYPKTITIFGGPNYPVELKDQEEFLRAHPAIDFHINGEGEYAASNLVKILFENDFDMDAIKSPRLQIPNIGYLVDKKMIVGGRMPRSKTLDDIPSPWTTGMLDEFLEDERLLPLMQTKRGCPFTCGFCQEGADYFTKISRLNEQRTLDDFDYISPRARVTTLQLADSNFAMYAEDIRFVQHIAEKKKENGFPGYIICSTGKNKRDNVTEAARILNGEICFSASVQSTDPEVLANIRRSNIRIEDMVGLIKDSEKYGTMSLGEIILGLPGDTKQKHIKSVTDMIDLGVNTVRSYQFLLLSGSEISDTIESKEKWGIESRHRVIPRNFGMYTLFGETFPAAETDEIVVKSNSLSFEDYLECRKLNLTTEIFYNGRLFGELANFLTSKDLRTSELIVKIHDSIINDPQNLSPVYEGYLRENNADLYESKEELRQLLLQPSYIEGLMQGKAGNNELFNYRAMAFFNQMPDLHKVAFNMATELLKEKGKYDEPTAKYLNELHRFSLLRKQDLRQFNEEFTEPFHFNFPELMKNNFEGNPYDFYAPQGLTHKIINNDVQKDKMFKDIRQYGSTIDGLSRILQRTNISSVYRDAHIIA
jgi:radical SAM superfamily enzyme YgiQ (UPF0313 family)